MVEIKKEAGNRMGEGWRAARSGEKLSLSDRAGGTDSGRNKETRSAGEGGSMEGE